MNKDSLEFPLQVMQHLQNEYGPVHRYFNVSIMSGKRRERKKGVYVLLKRRRGVWCCFS